MNKAIKKRIATVTACLASAVMCFGALVACDGGNDNGGTPSKPEVPQHFTAAAADCTTAGNIEYWTKGGKYYSDEACTTEITQAATIIAALNHDFENATYVNTDANKHWQICKREGCDEISEKVDHTYTNGTCVCGKAETPVHYDAAAADCTTAGNIEYWTKGGKYYSDATCETEITQEATVIAALNHDFENATYVNTDADQHWQVCKREGCDEISEKEDHTFNAEGACDCGRISPMADVTINAAGSVAQSVTAEYKKASVVIKSTATSNIGYDNLKVERPLANVELGKVYEITYTFTSDVAGAFDFDIDGTAQFLTEEEDLEVKVGANTIKVTFVATAKAGDEAIKSRLYVYGVKAFELEFTSIECEQKVGNYIDGWWVDKAGDCTTVTVTEPETTDGTKIIKMEGEVSTTTEGDNTWKNGWHIKLAKDVTLQEDHEYELTIVYKVTGGSEGNAKYVVYDNKVIIGSGANNELMWYNSQYDEGKIMVKTIKFTANDSCTIGSCFEIGEWTDSESDVIFTIAYMELTDVTPEEAE